MSLSTKTNQITGPAVAGDSATTDPAFTPKALIIWNGLQTTAGALADAQWSLGVAGSATTEIMAGWNSDDGTASSDDVRMISTTEILKNANAGATTVNNAATLSSFDANGFTLNFGTLNTASPIFNYLAIGGTDITNVESGTFASNTGTGNQSVNLAGAFQPDVVFLFATLLTSAAVGNNNSQYSFGVMDGSGNQWSMCGKSQNSQTTMNTSRAFYNTKCFVMQATTTNNVFQDMSFVSMDSDGFTFNIDTAGGTAILIGYLAIKGGQWKVGSDTAKTTSTGTKATTGVGFTPQGVMFGSACDTQTAGTADHYRMMFGAMTGASNNTSLWAGHTDNVADAICDTIMSATSCITIATEGTPTTNAAADFDSFDADGFTLNWTTVDANAYVFGYVAYAANAVAATPSTGYPPTLLMMGAG